MIRSSVDLPEPERPSRPTISQSFNVRFTPSRTSNSLPPGRGKERATSRTSKSVSLSIVASSAEPEFALGVPIERPPEQAVDDRDQETHHRDAKHDAMKISRRGGFGNISAQTVSAQRVVSPAGDFG